MFREALDRYAGSAAALDLSAFVQAESLAEALRQMFETAIVAFTDSGGERGCLISTSMIAAHADHTELTKELAHRRREFRESLAALLARWTTVDDADEVARFVSAVLLGIAVQARDGAAAKELRDVASAAIRGATQP